MTDSDYILIEGYTISTFLQDNNLYTWFLEKSLEFNAFVSSDTLDKIRKNSILSTEEFENYLLDLHSCGVGISEIMTKWGILIKNLSLTTYNLTATATPVSNKFFASKNITADMVKNSDEYEILTESLDYELQVYPYFAYTITEEKSNGD